MTPARRYGLVVGPEFREQLESAPAAIQDGLWSVLGILLSGPLPGESELTVRPFVPWLPDRYTAVVPSGGLLTYQVDRERALITLLDLTWL